VNDAPKARILVVDDDPFFLRVLEKRFGAEGFSVVTATNGRDGMREIVTSEPDLVISDWMMPEVDGLELCQSVKTGLRDDAPYFILLTAKGELSDRLLGLETGADDYLVKPCDHAELMARVRAGLRIVNLTAQLRRSVQELRGAGAPESPSAPGMRAAPAPADGVRTGSKARSAAGTAGHAASDPAAWCPHCRRVRGADGEWRPIEAWIEQRLGPGTRCARPDCPPGEDRAAA
jgi:CheY-like chemotaxis protein